ncbi:conjugal transfer protein TraG N-terminal domain-containing protein [Photorhabdus heterorhabditis]|uniref:conjugal transfer protein TraG N-terminal domain-containing protein n=1 Tax=Photorhabdus heterorhabditis TaxID=880156 RepID=UPI001562352B|nr:conjugal transfer protein TraG N-terminal domain-containing protein [Photorhabdus heterorhabditis]NRN29022.1 conjugal transfer protein TraG [Photorhabdus heterorhabditis subsp. aluminescens]
MDFNIYTLGDIDFVWSAFNGIALIFSKYRGVREFMTTAAVLAGLHLFYKSYLWLLNPLKNEIPVFNFILGLIVFSIAVMRVDVTIESVKSGEVRAVNDVPILIAATATLTTNLSQGLLRDYKTAFDPLAPPDLASTTLNDDLTLGPMIKFVKFIQWGGDSQGYCSLFPSPSSKIGNLNLCLTVQSVSLNCLKATQNSTASIAGKENIFNDIFSTDISDSMSKITAAVSSGMRNASAQLVGTNGSISKPCSEVWADVLAIKDRPESQNLMRTIGQVNGILSPDDATGYGGDADFTSTLKAANGLYGKAIQAHDAMTNLFVLNNLQKGAQQYQTALGLATEMQLFEASIKRTNNMASQGQLWQHLSGAAISFLEMFAYMVAPFSLLMLIALGGNGVAAAAKYLQLVVFVNMWPITAVMVNAYVKKVVTADLDTWTTLNASNNAVTWSGLAGVAETYSSYLSVASALYALIPVLTLFVMTQSIHPMMSATKGITPDAPINNSHLTPQVWTAPDAGKTSFGDVSHTSAVSTGQGLYQGGFNNSNLPRIGEWNVGSQISDSMGHGAASQLSNMRSSQQSFSRSLNNATELAKTGAHNDQYSQQLAQTIALSDKLSSTMANSLAKSTGMSFSTGKTRAQSFLLTGGASGLFRIGTPSGSPVNVSGGVDGGVTASAVQSNNVSESMNKILNGAYKHAISTDLATAQELRKGLTRLSSDTFGTNSSVKDAFSQVQQDARSVLSSASMTVTTDGKQGSSNGMQFSQTVNLDAVSDSIKGTVNEDSVRAFARANGLNEDAFTGKYNSYLDMFRNSNTLGESINRRDALVSAVRDESNAKIRLDAEETQEHNMQDMRDTSALLKSLTSTFGANNQQLNPVINQLDSITGGKSAGNYVVEQQGKLGRPDTSGVMSANQINAAGNQVDGNVNAHQRQQDETANKNPDGTVAGIKVADLNDEIARGVYNGRANQNRAAVVSQDEQSAIQKIDDTSKPFTKRGAETLTAIEQAVTDNLRKTDVFLDAVTGAKPAAVLSGAVKNAQYEMNTDRNFESADSYIERVNQSNKSNKEKGQNLVAQAAFTLGVMERSGPGSADSGDDSKEQVEMLRQEARKYGVDASYDDLRRIHMQSSRYNNGHASVDDVVKATYPDGSNHSDNSDRSYLRQSYVIGTPVPTEIDDQGGKQIRQNDISGNSALGVAKGVTYYVDDGVQNVLGKLGLGMIGDGARHIGRFTGSSNSAADTLNLNAMSTSLTGNIGQLAKINATINATKDNMGFSADSMQPYENAKQTNLSNIKTTLSEDPHYGPEVADKFSTFYSSLPNNIGQEDAKDLMEQFLNENKKK